MAVRLGFIGIGGIAGAHLEGCRNNGIPVTAAFDIDKNRVKERQEEYGIEHAVGSPQELAEHPDVDAVVVCSPQHVHLEGIEAACNAGKPLLTEKPLARTIDDAKKAVDLVEKAGVFAQIGFVRRYCPDWGAFKQLVEEGAIGRPVVWWMMGGGPGPGRSFFNQAHQGGGPMLDGMVHNYDFARYMWGEPTRVMGSCVRLHPVNTALDTGTGIIEFSEGDRHTVCNSWGMPEGVRSESVHNVLGPKGIFYFNDPDDAPPEGLDRAKEGYFVTKTEGGERHVHRYERWSMMDRQITDFVKAVEEKRPEAKATMLDGLRAMEIALKILGEL